MLGYEGLKEAWNNLTQWGDESNHSHTQLCDCGSFGESLSLRIWSKIYLKKKKKFDFSTSPRSFQC